MWLPVLKRIGNLAIVGATYSKKMKPKKFKVHKTYSIDSEVCERWERVISSQEKDFSETIEEHMSQDIDTFENKRLVRSTTEQQRQLIPIDEEFKQFVKDRVTPLFDKETEMLAVEYSQLRSLQKIMEGQVDKIKLGLKLVDSPLFREILKHDKLEQERLQGLEAAKQYREKNARFDLMKELPYPLDEQEMKKEQEAEATREAELLALQKQKELRKKKIQALKEDTERKLRGDWSDEIEITREEIKIPKREDQIRNEDEGETIEE
jgi:hypothetical protein